MAAAVFPYSIHECLNEAGQPCGCEIHQELGNADERIVYHVSDRHPGAHGQACPHTVTRRQIYPLLPDLAANLTRSEGQ